MNLPSEFETYTRQLLGDALYNRLKTGLEAATTPVSIRLNPFKTRANSVSGSRPTPTSDVEDTLLDSIVPWCPAAGRYLKARPNFTFDPLLHAGAYYVQEAGSMFVDHVVRTLIKHPVTMLDLCAAPGGKSTALRAALPEGSLLFSNEPMRLRAQVLSENLQKFGHEDVIVTNNYPRDYRKAHIMFDAILADVPCSGEGMFRKDDGARAEWSTQNVDNCWRLQREIISDIWPCLRPGGLLVYSTCTFNAHEDEENVEWIAKELGAEFVEVPTDESWNITPAVAGSAPVYRFLPGISRSEGLFLAVLRKGGVELPLNAKTENAATCVGQELDTSRRGKKKSAKRRDSKATKLPSIPIPLTSPSHFALHSIGDTFHAIPTRWADTFDAAAAALKILHAGVGIGSQKGKDIIPDHSLALSRLLDGEAFPRVEIDYAKAIAYLRKEAVTLPPDTPRGFVVLTYRGVPIGFEKNIGNRANNLYPQEWRIKSTHVPEETVILNL